MVTVRRWYIYLVCLISLQAVAFASVTLLQNLLASADQTSTLELSFQIAVIIIGGPVFLAHWLWAQRLAAREPEDRAATLRRFYLYLVLAIFLANAAINTYDLLANLIARLFDVDRVSFFSSSVSITGTDLFRDLIALVGFGLFWFYHWRVTRADALAAPEVESAGSVRRLYILGFSAAGVDLTTLGVIHLLRWLMFQFGLADEIRGLGRATLVEDIALLIIGVALWAVFWRWAQNLFESADSAERASALRKFYLYAIVFIAALGAVGNATLILAGFLRAALGLEAVGDLRDPLPIVIVLAALWAYHAYLLQDDEKAAGEVARQANIRRLYHYLIAGIGLAALLIGLGGDLSVLIRSLVETNAFGDTLREQLAWFTAALLAGMPVWFLPWRRAQRQATAPDGADDRRSIVRKIYLYFYLFVATMTVLGGLVYIVYRILSLILGGDSAFGLVSDLGQAIAYALIAVGVWLYHGAAVRGDGQLNQKTQTQALTEIRLAVIDSENSAFGSALVATLQRELPALAPALVILPTATPAPGVSDPSSAAALASATVIVGQWPLTVPAETVAMLLAHPARKVLIPAQRAGWDWAGVENWSPEAALRQTVHAIKQITEGETVSLAKPPNVGGIIGGIVIAIVLIIIVLALLGPALGNLF